MAGRLLGTLLRHVQATAATGPADVDLLRRFVAGRDEEAFAALVHRHGPMVLGVCRRVLRDEHDAADAFQAAFLVLARKAGSLRRPAGVGNWLHGVAYRCALRARTLTRRRRGREVLVADVPESAGRPEERSHELLPLLDRELHRLPPKYRTPVILCELEGKSRRSAAALLGLSEGTLSSRLAAARKTLARRLARYAPGLAAGGVLEGLTTEATASLPAGLAEATARTAAAYVSGAGVPAQVVLVTKGVLRMMLWTKVKGLAGVALVGALVATGVHARLAAGGADEPRAAQAPANPSAKQEPAAAPRADVPVEGAKRPLAPYIVEPPDVLVVDVLRALPDNPLSKKQAVVRPDGTISLGFYGTVKVAGLTLDQIRAAIADQLQNKFGLKNPIVSVDVSAYNSKFYYVLTRGESGDSGLRSPFTGNETVLDALTQTGGLPPVARDAVTVVKRGGVVLPVDWTAITQKGDARTNYLLEPGDRIVIHTDGRLGRVGMNPFARPYSDDRIHITAAGNRVKLQGSGFSAEADGLRTNGAGRWLLEGKVHVAADRDGLKMNLDADRVELGQVDGKLQVTTAPVAVPRPSSPGTPAKR